MKFILKIGIGVITLIILQGFGGPKIDSTSIETMKESIQLIMSELSEEDKKLFQKSFESIESLIPIEAAADGKYFKTNQEVETQFYKRIDGKSAKDIIGMLKDIEESLDERRDVKGRVIHKPSEEYNNLVKKLKKEGKIK